MQTHFAEREIPYTGAELRSGWLRGEFGLDGDAIAAFIGPCDVAPEHMVDLADRAAGATIFSRRMLHFIVEHADPDLHRATLRQRLLVAVALECINQHSSAAEVCRDGDDLFHRRRKLSVSVATTSPTSGLIHLGLNVIAEGAPVPAADLTELGVDPRSLAEHVMAAYAAEMASIDDARQKVRPVE
ncbi:MAG: DUF366 family protein [Armatimonadota bacterium]|nr:MAG: DUF366 family protein [Armatimonadota bacterium]